MLLASSSRSARNRAIFSRRGQQPPGDEESDRNRCRSKTKRPQRHARIGCSFYFLEGLDRAVSLRVHGFQRVDERALDLISRHSLQSLGVLTQLLDSRFSKFLMRLGGLHQETEFHAVLVHGVLRLV